MQFHSSDQAGLLLTIYGETKEALGRIEAKMDGQAEASEIRHKHLHKRIDRVEEKLEQRPAPTSNLTFWSVAGALMRNWNPILAAIAVALSLFGIVMPEKVQSILGLVK